MSAMLIKPVVLPRLGPPPTVVLVVDDDDDQRAAMGDMLKDRGYAVVEAAHGHEVLEYLVDRRNRLPAVILLDLSMPVLTGWELLAILKGYPRLAKIPVVLLSGAEPQLDPLKHGTIAAFLRKPFTMAQLLTVLEGASPSAPAAPI
jgi:chemotaxis family two-component system sensor histidine kinase/response regulator PixL